jgi:NhaC family Na+:H+ antiporter
VLSIKTKSGWTFGLGLSAHIPLFLAATVSAISGMVFLKTPWRKLEDGMISAITVAMQAIIILLAIGGLVGSWIQSGVVPTLIFYGLNMLSPRFFLLACLLICAVVSLSTGSSWSTSGTVGIALMGIGAGLGIPAPVTAGFILSGAYFGDKISPLSDTTNLAPAVSGAELFDHIKAMLWTTLPTLVIVMESPGSWERNTGRLARRIKISLIQQLMASEFPISLMGFVPPLLVLTLCGDENPRNTGIVSGMLLGSILALVHGLAIGSVLVALHSGYSTSLITKVSEAGDLTALAEAVKGSAMTLSERSTSKCTKASAAF